MKRKYPHFNDIGRTNITTNHTTNDHVIVRDNQWIPRQEGGCSVIDIDGHDSMTSIALQIKARMEEYFVQGPLVGSQLLSTYIQQQYPRLYHQHIQTKDRGEKIDSSMNIAAVLLHDCILESFDVDVYWILSLKGLLSFTSYIRLRSSRVQWFIRTTMIDSFDKAAHEYDSMASSLAADVLTYAWSQVYESENLPSIVRGCKELLFCVIFTTASASEADSESKVVYGGGLKKLGHILSEVELKLCLQCLSVISAVSNEHAMEAFGFDILSELCSKEIPCTRECIRLLRRILSLPCLPTTLIVRYFQESSCAMDPGESPLDIDFRSREKLKRDNSISANMLGYVFVLEILSFWQSPGHGFTDQTGIKQKIGKIRSDFPFEILELCNDNCFHAVRKRAGTLLIRTIRLAEKMWRIVEDREMLRSANLSNVERTSSRASSGPVNVSGRDHKKSLMLSWVQCLFGSSILACANEMEQYFGKAKSLVVLNDVNDFKWFCLQICEYVTEMSESALRALYAAIKSKREIASDAADTFLTSCKVQVKILEKQRLGIFSGKITPDIDNKKESAILADVTVDRVRYWATSLRRTQLLPLAVLQTCSLQGARSLVKTLVFVASSQLHSAKSNADSSDDRTPSATVTLANEIAEDCISLLTAIGNRQPQICSDEDIMKAIADIRSLRSMFENKSDGSSSLDQIYGFETSRLLGTMDFSELGSAIVRPISELFQKTVCVLTVEGTIAVEEVERASNIIVFNCQRLVGLMAASDAEDSELYTVQVPTVLALLLIQWISLCLNAIKLVDRQKSRNGVLSSIGFMGKQTAIAPSEHQSEAKNDLAVFLPQLCRTLASFGVLHRPLAAVIISLVFNPQALTNNSTLVGRKVGIDDLPSRSLTLESIQMIPELLSAVADKDCGEILREIWEMLEESWNCSETSAYQLLNAALKLLYVLNYTLRSKLMMSPNHFVITVDTETSTMLPLNEFSVLIICFLWVIEVCNDRRAFLQEMVTTSPNGEIARIWSEGCKLFFLLSEYLNEFYSKLEEELLEDLKLSLVVDALQSKEIIWLLNPLIMLDSEAVAITNSTNNCLELALKLHCIVAWRGHILEGHHRSLTARSDIRILGMNMNVAVINLVTSVVDNCQHYCKCDSKSLARRLSCRLVTAIQKTLPALFNSASGLESWFVGLQQSLITRAKSQEAAHCRHHLVSIYCDVTREAVLESIKQLMIACKFEVSAGLPSFCQLINRMQVWIEWIQTFLVPALNNHIVTTNLFAGGNCELLSLVRQDPLPATSLPFATPIKEYIFEEYHFLIQSVSTQSTHHKLYEWIKKIRKFWICDDSAVGSSTKLLTEDMQIAQLCVYNVILTLLRIVRAGFTDDGDTVANDKCLSSWLLPTAAGECTNSRSRYLHVDDVSGNDGMKPIPIASKCSLRDVAYMTGWMWASLVTSADWLQDDQTIEGTIDILETFRTYSSNLDKAQVSSRSHISSTQNDTASVVAAQGMCASSTLLVASHNIVHGRVLDFADPKIPHQLKKPFQLCKYILSSSPSNGLVMGARSENRGVSHFSFDCPEFTANLRHDVLRYAPMAVIESVAWLK